MRVAGPESSIHIEVGITYLYLNAEQAWEHYATPPFAHGLRTGPDQVPEICPKIGGSKGGSKWDFSGPRVPYEAFGRSFWYLFR